MKLSHLTTRIMHPQQVAEVSPQLRALLQLADPHWDLISIYLFRSDLLLLEQNGIPVACLVLQDLGDREYEIKNIAVRADLQGNGLGSRLLREAIRRATAAGARTLLIRTGNSSIGQLYLYQKTGFRIRQIDTDFFIRNYPEPIWENGIRCRDRITLTMDL